MILSASKFNLFYDALLVRLSVDGGKEYVMEEILEVIMLICFGISWPISVCKSIRSRSTSGKSVIFMLAIIVGYIAGIASKIVGDQINYVLFMYVLNLLMVSVDLAVYFVNRKRETEKLNLVQTKAA